MRLRLLALLLFACASPAVAQDRAPVVRESLTELAYVMGQAHGLRILCEGEGEQFWRARMLRLIEVEAPDEAFREQLLESFNTGFLGAQAAHVRCDAAARAKSVKVAAIGRDLARVLAGTR